MRQFLLGLASLALFTAPACTGAGTSDPGSRDAAVAEDRADGESGARTAEMKQCCKDAATLGKECAECAEKQ